MCDYSLQSVPNRLAVEGERLVVHRFRTGSIGLAPAPMGVQEQQPKAKLGFREWVAQLRKAWKTETCAVCIPPGARLLLHGMAGDAQASGVTAVTFTQLSAEVNRYRDAIVFADGRSRLLQHLAPGRLVDVVSLEGASGEREDVHEFARPVRPSFVR